MGQVWENRIYPGLPGFEVGREQYSPIVEPSCSLPIDQYTPLSPSTAFTCMDRVLNKSAAKNEGRTIMHRRRESGTFLGKKAVN